MIKYKKLILYTLFFVSLVYLSLNVLCDKKLYYEKDLTIKGKIIYLKRSDDKVVIDIKNRSKYRITLYKDINYELGDIIEVNGAFKVPSNNTVPNLYNYRKYLLSKKIKLISNNPNTKLVNRNKNIFYKLKNNMIKHINSYKSKSYLKTFVMGDTSSIEKDILEDYRNLGISHLLSISGMHMSVFLLILNFVLKRSKIKNIIIFMFLFLLLFITNYPESLIRCTLFIILKYINSKLKLKYSNIEILIFTFCILIFYNPFLMYSMGFIFSITITFFILISNNIYRNKNYIFKLIIISIICFLSSIPICANAFFNINLISPFINIIFVPIISIIIFPLGLLTYFIPFLDKFYYVITSGMNVIINSLSSIKYFIIIISKPNILVVLIYYFLLFISIKVNKKYLTLFLILLILNINSKYFILSPKVIFLNVGQGDSALIIYPKGKIMMIDTGGLYNSNYSIVLNKTIPYLNSIGINKLNKLVITHGDHDHCGETINLIDNFKVDKVIFNCGEFNDLEEELIKALDKNKIPYDSCVNKIDDLYFLQAKEYNNENDNSNVIYTEINNYKFMFMGDAGINKEKDILGRYDIENIDVLKVGHHGSKTSSSIEFINEMNSKYSIISVGKNNRYGHPNNEVLNLLGKSKIYRTDQDGSIIFKTKNNKLEIETYSP